MVYLKQSGVKTLYTLLTMGMVSFYLLDKKAGFINILHKQFNYICLFSVYCNWLLILMIHQLIIKSPNYFYIFNGLIFANTLIVFICMKRHGHINS